ncbi:MAG: hypothetical protein IPH44_15255 [Myxococcales bacterium]|nr:hypothetical protein [Myxococcales bacterium]MBK7193286.1 hypothetical protein [Myxococcales bacterium]MBP6842350.1 hypothetical protein [Kofleriaceae bacterium]
MEPALLVFTKVAVGVALAAPVAVRAWKRRRATRAARPATIGEALEGVPVRVVGRIVEAEATLQAPMTGRRCAGYHVLVEERASQQWEWRGERREGRELVIEDATGRAIVDLTTAAISDEVSVRVGRTTLDEPTVAALLQARPGPPPRGQLRWRERALEVGTSVAVVGRAVREPDPDAVHRVTGYRAGPPTRLRFTGSPARPVLVTDDPEFADPAT